VAGDGEDDDLVVGGPGSEHAVGAVEVAAAHVVECGAGEAVAGGGAALGAQFRQRDASRLAAAAAEVTDFGVRPWRSG